jgi:hypothetical protein
MLTFARALSYVTGSHITGTDSENGLDPNPGFF